MSWMIFFADRRLRGEEWHWAGIVLLVRGDVTDPWHTDRCWFAAPPFDSIATALRALNGERRENAGAVRKQEERSAGAVRSSQRPAGEAGRSRASIKRGPPGAHILRSVRHDTNLG